MKPLLETGSCGDYFSCDSKPYSQHAPVEVQHPVELLPDMSIIVIVIMKFLAFSCAHISCLETSRVGFVFLLQELP